MKLTINIFFITTILSVNISYAGNGEFKSITRFENRINPRINNHPSQPPAFHRTAEIGQKFAIIIGQDAYKQNSLKTCVNDAKKIDYVVKEKLNYQKSNVKLFLDRQVSYAILKKLILDLSLITKKNDFIFFYYSGHGVKVFDPVKQKKTSALLLSTYESVKARIFAGWISKIKAQSLFIFDSCYSGGMFTSEFAGAIQGEVKSANQPNSNRYYFLSSSGSNEISMTMPAAGLSRFTYFFQKALLENLGDTNNDGKLSLLEVFNWSKAQTVSYGEKFGYRHSPVFHGEYAEKVILKKIERGNTERNRQPEAPNREPHSSQRVKHSLAI